MQLVVSVFLALNKRHHALFRPTSFKLGDDICDHRLHVKKAETTGDLTLAYGLWRSTWAQVRDLMSGYTLWARTIEYRCLLAHRIAMIWTKTKFWQRHKSSKGSKIQGDDTYWRWVVGKDLLPAVAE